MERLFELLQQNDAFIRTWGYAALFIAAWIEGLNSLIIGGFIASLGKLSVWGVLAVVTLGHAMAGYSWYAVGYFAGAVPLERWGKRIKITPERLAQARSYFERHGGKAILFTKFTVGLTIATLIFAGTLKMRFKQFSGYNIFGSLVWASLTVFFGYTFGLSFRLLAQYIESFTRLLVFFFVFLGGAIAAWYLLRMLWRSRFLRMFSGSAKTERS